MPEYLRLTRNAGRVGMEAGMEYDRDYYALQQVSRTAEVDVINSAVQTLRKRYHRPDTGVDLFANGRQPAAGHAYRDQRGYPVRARARVLHAAIRERCWGPHRGVVDRTTVTVPRGFEMVELVVPLASFVVVGHRRLSGRWFPKGPTSRCELMLASDQGDERITVSGSWLSLAWLAYLGGWREPLT